MLAVYLNYFESETKAGNFYVWKKLDQLEEREKARKNLKADIDAKTGQERCLSNGRVHSNKVKSQPRASGLYRRQECKEKAGVCVHKSFQVQGGSSNYRVKRTYGFTREDYSKLSTLVRVLVRTFLVSVMGTTFHHIFI